jgi:hypothetical protein
VAARTANSTLAKGYEVCALAEEGSFVLSPPPLSLALRFDATAAPNRATTNNNISDSFVNSRSGIPILIDINTKTYTSLSLF